MTEALATSTRPAVADLLDLVIAAAAVWGQHLQGVLDRRRAPQGRDGGPARSLVSTLSAAPLVACLAVAARARGRGVTGTCG